ncbi:MAG: monovalent cation/H+ antiporter subunit D family protein [Proteobacteria bacterium]|nr:monovalent cation/H+ antiporter subunit D family protein [Pseudomonadota bacterium]MBU1688482.1 monovalent cation/H+ antiporter subunit D family protein [Pseudomonadota bacterium]
MINPEQYPILIVIVPFLSAFFLSITGCFKRSLCRPIALLALFGAAAAAVGSLHRVITTGIIHYRLGGWPPPFGIEYVIDHLNGLVLVVITLVALLAAIFSGKSVERELPGKEPLFYALFLLLVVGLLGMTITGDAFNLYVLLEISSLTAYALIAIGQDRAIHASFNYLIIGTIGASFYLLGVGHLYIMTGSLNMADLASILPQLYGSKAILTAFLLILIGVWTKMAFFPLHTWLPNSYTYAPTATSCLVAPLMTKVAVYIMIRMMFSVFTPAYVFHHLAMAPVVIWMAIAAIVGGSLLALSQRDFKKMLTYLIVAEVGYMVGGIWLANRLGITGAILHIVNDAFMTLCLFLAAGTIIHRTGGHHFDNLKGLFHQMPLTMTAFTIGALSMIGVPPTAGFFSKWYLILGSIQAGRYEFVAALLFSSLVNAVLFFRLLEISYFEKPPHQENTAHGPVSMVAEAPLTMLVPLLVSAITLIVLGIYSGELVTKIIQFAVPAGI